MLSSKQLESLADLADRMADSAGQAALKHFRQLTLTTDNKAGIDGFDPVTVADREAEEAMRAILAIERPSDGIFGEEQGQTSGTSGLTWVIDPIDGTRAFISGLPTWGVLIGLDDGASGQIGVIDQPFTGERFTGINGEIGRASYTRMGQSHQIQTRACADLASVTLMTTAPELFTHDESPAFEAIRLEARLTRYGTDCYAYAMLAMGQIDLVIESGLHAYDIAGPAALVRAAGGVVSDWKGGDCRWGGRTIAAGDPRIHKAALRILSTVGG